MKDEKGIPRWASTKEIIPVCFLEWRSDRRDAKNLGTFSWKTETESEMLSMTVNNLFELRLSAFLVFRETNPMQIRPILKET